MYLLSFLAVILVSIFTIGITSSGLLGNWTGFGLYFDLWSFIILIVLCVPILISSGLAKDFNNAFRLAGKTKKKRKTDPDEGEEKKEEEKQSLLEVKRAIEAVSFVRKVLLAGGIFIVLLTFVFIFSYLLTDYERLEIYVSVALLPLIYAFAADIFLLPIESRLRINLQEMMHQ